MAKGEVQVKDINVVKRYKEQLGDVMTALNDHMAAFQRALEAKLQELQAMKKEVFEEQQKLLYEIRDARRVYEDSLEVGTYEIETYPDGSYQTHFVPDWGYRLQCQREYEHLAGPIYHQVDHYTEIAHNRMMSATKAANYAVNKLNSTKFTVGNYLNRGKQYIAKMTPHIEQYIQNKI
jgi:hypothetical protein